MNNTEYDYLPATHASEDGTRTAFTILAYFVVASVVLAAVIGTQLPFLNNSDKNQASTLEGTIQHIEEQPSKKPAMLSFDVSTLNARAVIVYDVVRNEPLFEFNAHKRLPLASLAKIMTALVAIEYFDPDTQVTITEKTLKTEGDEGLLVHDRLSVASLASLTLVSSSNDGAEALANVTNRETFIAQMNERARELDLVQTSFFNPSGLDINERLSGGYGSAADIAHLLLISVQTAPNIFAPTIKPIFHTSSYRVKNTNNRIDDITGLIASKTGFTDLAGGNLAIMFDAGLAQPIIVVVLGSTPDGRFDDAYNLANATRAYLAIER